MPTMLSKETLFGKLGVPSINMKFSQLRCSLHWLQYSTVCLAVVVASHTHGDIIVTYLREHHTNLTPKSLSVLQWIHNSCASTKYILKTHDDCYNNPQLFVEFLTKTRKLPRNFIGGLSSASRPIRDFSSKDYTTLRTIYSDTYYTTYCSGQAYLMPFSTLRHIYQTSSHTRYFHLEDIFQGRIQGGGPGPPLTTKNEAPAPKFYKTEAPEWQF